MASIKFIYKQIPFDIHANENDLFKDVIEKFAQKSNVDLKTVYFTADGGIIQGNPIIKEILKNSKEKSILVQMYDEDENEKVYIESKEIICPECKEPCRFQMDNYKIKLSNCKNGHIAENIKLKEFQNKQKVNYTDIICDICKENNKGDSTDYQFKYCLTCKKNLCILCDYKHDKTHKVINHDNKYYICSKHNDKFSKFCVDCQKNICIACEDEHVTHKTESFSNIMLDINQIRNNQKEIKASINLLNEKMKEIVDEITENLEALYKINENMIKLFENRNRNYQILKNANDINFHNKLIIDEINNISNNEKLMDIIHIYNKMKDIQIQENISIKKEQTKIQYNIPISKEGLIKIYNNMIKYVCGIQETYSFYKKKEIGSTGFFAKIPFNSKMLHVLITNNQNVEKSEIKEKKKIKIYLNKNEEMKTISLDDTRKRYVNQNLDITIIEIKKEDGIKFFYELDVNLIRFFSENKKEIFRLSNEYNNEFIYSINYQEDKGIYFSYGLINDYQEKGIQSTLNTDKLISGGPIVLLNNSKVIGINNKFRTPLIQPIIEFQTIKDNLLIIEREKKTEKSKKTNEESDENSSLKINLNLENIENRPLNEMEIEYSFYKEDEKFQIFGEEFVNNNKDKCKIIIDGKEQELSKTLDLKKNQK